MIWECIIPVFEWAVWVFPIPHHRLFPVYPTSRLSWHRCSHPTSSWYSRWCAPTHTKSWYHPWSYQAHQINGIDDNSRIFECMGSIQGRCEHPCQPQYCRSSFFKLRYRNLIGLVKCFSGGFISDAVGDGLVSAGVNLQSMYGTTETGPISRYGTPPGSDWAWIEIWHKMSIEWFDQGNGTYECHYLVCEVRLLWKFTLQHAHRKENCTSLRF